MKVYLTQLLGLHGELFYLDEEMTNEFSDVKHSVLKKVDRCRVTGHIEYDESTRRALTQLKVVGSMILPHSVTNQLVSIPFDIDLLDIFSFVDGDTDEEVIEVKEDFIDINRFVLDGILATIPLRIVDDNPYEYPSGKGWKVMSEVDYDAIEKPMDPRLAKLKEFKFD